MGVPPLETKHPYSLSAEDKKPAGLGRSAEKVFGVQEKKQSVAQNSEITNADDSNKEDISSED